MRNNWPSVKLVKKIKVQCGLLGIGFRLRSRLNGGRFNVAEAQISPDVVRVVGLPAGSERHGQQHGRFCRLKQKKIIEIDSPTLSD
jgi:hypothetical protein